MSDTRLPVINPSTGKEIASLQADSSEEAAAKTDHDSEAEESQEHNNVKNHVII